LPSVYRCFYSRKSYFFPERQKGPHREWKNEVEYLDGIFKNGAAYTVGKVNGDHWLLYITSPYGQPPSPVVQAKVVQDFEPVDDASTSDGLPTVDYTIEILMSELAPDACKSFMFGPVPEGSASDTALDLSSAIGISDLFPPRLTTLDAYAFSPCGYSSNALIKWGEPISMGTDTMELNDSRQCGEGYYTIHVTPEEGWSYASFECNVPLSELSTPQSQSIPDLRTLVRRVVDIFQPGRLSLTLFISCNENNDAGGEGESTIDAAQRAFKAALTSKTTASGTAPGSGVYKRTDKINYEFGGYELAFASFELVMPRGR